MFNVSKLKDIAAVLLIVLVMIVAPMPLPINPDPPISRDIFLDKWNCSIIKMDINSYTYCMTVNKSYSPDDKSINIRISPGAEIYIEKVVNIPDRATTFEYMSFDNNAIGVVNFPSLFFIDENGIYHHLRMSDVTRIPLRDYFIIFRNLPDKKVL